VEGGSGVGKGDCSRDEEFGVFVGVDDNALLVGVLFTGNSGSMVAFDGTRVLDIVVLGDNLKQ